MLDAVSLGRNLVGRVGRVDGGDDGRGMRVWARCAEHTHDCVVPFRSRHGEGVVRGEPSWGGQIPRLVWVIQRKALRS